MLAEYKKLYFGATATSSAYCSEIDGQNFIMTICIVKTLADIGAVEKATWETMHLAQCSLDPASQQVTYNITSTVLITIQSNDQFDLSGHKNSHTTKA
jgi:hypothetical protein